MKGVDTNVLIRYLVQDDKVQTQKAIFFLENECNQKSPAFITGIVLCELVWVLESAYEYHREQIADVLEHILRTRQFHIHEPDILWRALRGYKEAQADFSYHYIIHLNHEYGCDETVTFDKKAAKLPFATIL
ncbi:MAG: PIN domain-containing protein [Gammaproteobacteria bacterium]